jgi:hypothetical protein
MKMKAVFLIMAQLALICMLQAQTTYTTQEFRLGLDQQGAVSELTDLARQVNYAAGERSFLLGIKTGGKVLEPVGCELRNEGLTYRFPGDLSVDLGIRNRKTYLRLEVLKISQAQKIEAIVWGPIHTTIRETVGEFVGVVRNQRYALGIQALNVKTTGGALIDDQGYVPPRGSTALPTEHGSSLQAFCIDRTRPQKIMVWNGFGNAEVAARAEFGPVGSAIALFGTETGRVLELIGQIEVQEGLPHILIDGEWVKKSPLAGRPYIISNFGESTFDRMLDFTEKVGFYSLYHSHPFQNWGHFDLIPSLFPNGRQGMKNCVEKARERNIRVGVHTLTNFITTNDPFVSPVPHKDLASYASTLITAEIGKNDGEIPIADSTFYHKKTTLQTVRIGEELIRFSGISEDAPFALMNCQRGAFGTSAGSHKKGEQIARLIDHPYKTFYPNMDLQNEIIDNLVDFFNETGVSHLDFDGHEGAYSTGYGDASKDYFALRFLEGVDHKVVNGTSQSSHFYWHLNTYMNWGEPWYGGMRESQNEIRFNNQATLERNYQPNMLGWFWYREGTTLEEMEWMLARAAGWNAGYALVVHPGDLLKNENTGDVIEAIRTWEEAKQRALFNEAQIQLLKAGENDFSLHKISDKVFQLQYYRKETFSHENLVLQPGQPHYSSWRFHNNSGDQALYFRLQAVGQMGELKEILLELDGSQSLALPVSLKAGYSCIYDGKGKLLVYDEKGSLQQQVEVGWKQIRLNQGSHVLRVSCTFGGDGNLKLQGMVKLKDKVELIGS